MWVQQAVHVVEYTQRVSISPVIYGYNPCRIDVPTVTPLQTRVRVNAVIGWGESDDWTWGGITQCNYGRKWCWMTITVSGGFRISQMGRGNNNPWISGKNLYLARYMLKTAWKWKKWTDRGRVSLDPPRIRQWSNQFCWPVDDCLHECLISVVDSVESVFCTVVNLLKMFHVTKAPDRKKMPRTCFRLQLLWVVIFLYSQDLVLYPINSVPYICHSSWQQLSLQGWLS